MSAVVRNLEKYNTVKTTKENRSQFTKRNLEKKKQVSKKTSNRKKIDKVIFNYH